MGLGRACRWEYRMGLILHEHINILSLLYRLALMNVVHSSQLRGEEAVEEFVLAAVHDPVHVEVVRPIVGPHVALGVAQRQVPLAPRGPLTDPHENVEAQIDDEHVVGVQHPARHVVPARHLVELHLTRSVRQPETNAKGKIIFIFIC